MKYRKKPIEIEAVKFEYTEDGLNKLKEFCGDSLGKPYKNRHIDAKAEVEILTLEDGSLLRVAHIATEGDYVIKGVAGEFYACKPDIFYATYEKVKELPYRYKVAYGSRGSGKSWALLPAPPHPKIRLTNEEIRLIVRDVVSDVTASELVMFYAVARAIEEKIWEKNK